MSFSYNYTFNDGNENVSVVVDYNFPDIDTVENISRYPHRQRRAFGRHVLENYSADTFHSGTLLTIHNPFVRQLGKLFGGRFWFYWTRRHQDTLVFITGLAFIHNLY